MMAMTGDQEKTHTAYPLRLPFFFLTLIVMIIWIFPGLLGHDPWKPDEAYSFGLVENILHTGNWLVPTLADEPFMEKPPIYYLTAAAIARLLSGILPDYDAARLASGFYMALTFLFTGLAARELYGKGSAWLAPLLLLGCLGLAHRMHQMITDVALLSGFAMGFYGLCLASRRFLLGGFWLGTGTGLTFLSKGLLGPGIMGIFVSVLPVIHIQWRNKNYASTLLAAFVAFLPWMLIWPLALYWHSTSLFYEWFWTNNFGRFFGTVKLGPTKRSGFYFKTLLWLALPVWPMAAAALLRQPRRSIRKPALLLPLVFFIVMLSILGAASDARELYAIPMLLPLAVLATPGCLGLSNFGAKLLGRSGIILFSIAAVILWLVWLTAELKQPAVVYQYLRQQWPDVHVEFSLLLFALAAACSLFWLLLIRWNSGDAKQSVLNWSGGAALVWALIMTLYLPILDQRKSYRQIFTEIRDFLPGPGECVSSRYLGEPQRALLQYFAGLVTYRVEIPERHRNCNYLLVQYRGHAYDYLLASMPGWTSVWRGRRPRSDEFFILYRKNNNVLNIPVE